MFAYPWGVEEAYFPGARSSPSNAKALWKKIDRLASDVDDFYAGHLCETSGLFRPWLRTRQGNGQRFVERRRLTEMRCRKSGGDPKCAYVCVGASVGVGSLAGMRVLNYLALRQARLVDIWPFSSRGRAVRVVEIYPSFYYRLARADRANWRDATVAETALRCYSVEWPPDKIDARSQDEVDALVSSAALRKFAADGSNWVTPNDRCVSREGWIFGVPL